MLFKYTKTVIIGSMGISTISAIRSFLILKKLKFDKNIHPDEKQVLSNQHILNTTVSILCFSLSTSSGLLYKFGAKKVSLVMSFISSALCVIANIGFEYLSSVRLSSEERYKGKNGEMIYLDENRQNITEQVLNDTEIIKQLLKEVTDLYNKDVKPKGAADAKGQYMLNEHLMQKLQYAKAINTIPRNLKVETRFDIKNQIEDGVYKTVYRLKYSCFIRDEQNKRVDSYYIKNMNHAAKAIELPRIGIEPGFRLGNGNDTIEGFCVNW